MYKHICADNVCMHYYMYVYHIIELYTSYVESCVESKQMNGEGGELE